MITVEQAYKILTGAAREYGSETLPLREALGHELAEDVVARLSQPPADMSAMDGYAVRFADCTVIGSKLKVIGEASAGMVFPKALAAGQAVRIFTGGVIPKGADHILIQEHACREGDHIMVTDAQSTPRHIRKSGLDFAYGEILIRTGNILGPVGIGLAASANYDHLQVKARPKIALIANGNELRTPGSDLNAGEIIASNQYALAALIESWGAKPIDMGIIPDQLEQIIGAFEKAQSAHIILPIGGASVGNYDYMKTAFKELGGELAFEKVAVRPGKPVWFGHLKDSLVLGLPGNPASALVCAHLFLKPLLMGQTPGPVHKIKLDDMLPANEARTHYLRARIYADTKGEIWVRAEPRTDSALQTPFLRANALIHLPPYSGPYIKGDFIDVIRLGHGPDIMQNP